MASDLEKLAILYETIASHPSSAFRAGRVVLMGLINHCHSLLNGGLQSATNGNGAVWSACFRGLAELFGACVLIEENPQSITSLAESVKAGKLYNAVGRKNPGLKADIDRLHKIVHPSSGAIYAGMEVQDENTRQVNFRFGLYPLTNSDAKEAIIVLANLADMLVQKFTQFSGDEQLLSQGKIIVDRTPSSI